MLNIKNNSIFKFLGFGVAVAMFAVAFSPITTNAYSIVGSGFYSYEDDGASNPTVNDPTSNTAPVVISISPNAAVAGSGAKNVTITGRGFTPGSVARYNSSDRATTYVSSTKLLMELNANDVAVPGKYLVSVWNGNPNGGQSNTVLFTVTNGQVGGVSTTNNSNNSNSNNSNSSAPTAVTHAATSATSASSVKSNETKESNLSASAIKSGTTFMPQTFLQWLLLCILILLAVVLWRKLTVTDKEKNAPLKHA